MAGPMYTVRVENLLRVTGEDNKGGTGLAIAQAEGKEAIANRVIQ